MTNKNHVCRQFYNRLKDPTIKISDFDLTNLDEYNYISDNCIPRLNKYMLDKLKKINSVSCDTEKLYNNTQKQIKSIPNKCINLPKHEYHRDYFLLDWYDSNNDSCNTRTEVLANQNMDDNSLDYFKDSKNKYICSISKGKWLPYFTTHKNPNNQLELIKKEFTDTKTNVKVSYQDAYRLHTDNQGNISSCNLDNKTSSKKLYNFLKDNYIITKNNDLKTVDDIKQLIDNPLQGISTISHPNKDTINYAVIAKCLVKEQKEIIEPLTKTDNTLDIDHIVPLGNAWISGAWKWKPWQLKAYANDMTDGHLEAVPSGMNRSKGDNSISEWKPSDYNEFNFIIDKKADCQYASDYTSIKHRWNLKITDDEYNTLSDIFNSKECNNILSKQFVELDKPGKSLQTSFTNPKYIEMNLDYQKYNDIKNKFHTDEFKNYCFNSKDKNNTIQNKLYKEIYDNAKLLNINNIKYLEKIKNNNQINKDNLCKIIFY
jgi:hypothetical protein